MILLVKLHYTFNVKIVVVKQINIIYNGIYLKLEIGKMKKQNYNKLI